MAEGVPSLCLDDSIGPQRNSLRPSSAGYSFPRSERTEVGGKVCKESPGPCLYENEVPTKHSQSAIFGTGVGRRDFPKPYQYQDIAEDYHFDSYADSRQKNSARACFGREGRGGEVRDFDLMKNCPEHRYGKSSPGFIYTPDDRKVRPQSAPAWTIPSRRPSSAGPSTCNSRRPSSVGPGSYQATSGALGPQLNSRRKTARSSSFSRAERFPVQKTHGDLADECRSVDSAFGGQCTSRRKTASKATFGRSTRECNHSNGMKPLAADRPPSARMGPPRMPHPDVAPRKELIRFGSDYNNFTH